jgi:hypothetical protein
MPQPICTVMVGLPGLGKSTIVDFQCKVYDGIGQDIFVYSTDGILERIAAFLGKTYDNVFEEHIKSATAEADIDLAHAIKQRQDIIWDQTNTGLGKRRKIINRMKQAGYQVRCECIIPPEAGHLDDLKVWKHRLANRPGKTIPDHIINIMYESYVEPTISEGFDMVTYYDMYGTILGIDYGEEK